MKSFAEDYPKHRKKYWEGALQPFSL